MARKTNRKDSAELPAHLPMQFMSNEQYRRLYAFNDGMDDYMEDQLQWREKRIRPGLTAEQVYRKLPSAAEFEYGGYLTKTRIRYAACDPTKAYAPQSKPCTFHSHPTDLDGTEPDIPSVFDLYAFLKWRSLRAITVGKDLIWVLEKSRRTIPTIRKLADWESKNMVREIQAQMDQHSDVWGGYYMRQVIKTLGIKWPLDQPLVQFRQTWPDLLREHLRIRVTLLDPEST